MQFLGFSFSPRIDMHYRNVCLESFGYVVPDEAVSSSEIERRLEPLYQRLRLPEGRLELMTGIRERRFWPAGALPSDFSIRSGALALEAADFDPGQIGALIHGSVCRDRLEPATACRVHHHLGLPASCQIFDVSNACLGLLSGMLQVANMIELGQIRAGLVLGTESGRQLVEHTIDTLNRSETLTRAQLKLAVASLTIGSASCAVLLTHRSLSRTQNLLTAAAVRAHTQHHELCHSGGGDEAGPGMRPLMDTDSEQLLREGIAAGVATHHDFLTAAGWTPEMIDRTFCHQVGVAHRKQMLAALQVPPAKDFSTFEWLGNTGAVALPITMAIGLQAGHVSAGQRVAMFGIGSGINCVMLAAHWQHSLVAGAPPDGFAAHANRDAAAAVNPVASGAGR